MEKLGWGKSLSEEVTTSRSRPKQKEKPMLKKKKSTFSQRI